MSAGHDKKYRWSIADLFAIQILAIPLLSSRYYADVFFEWDASYVSLFKLFLAPFAFISIMSLILVHKWPRRSKVYAGIRYGTGFGLFFLMCVFGLRNMPFLFHHLYETIGLIVDWHNTADAIEAEPLLLEFYLKPYLITLIALTYFSVMGAAIGGVVGLVYDRRVT